MKDDYEHPEYGRRGDTIPSSNLYRVFCSECGAAMRSATPMRITACHDCTTHKGAGKTRAIWKDDEDAIGGWAGVVRAYEDNG
jgi:hypothetical protein